MRSSLLLPALLALASTASAQPPEPKIAAVKPQEPATAIPLRFVPATLMRRWLVPPKQAGAHATRGTAFELPEGVREVLPVEAETELQVRATPEGLDRLRQIAELLDRPLRQVVVQVRVLKVERDAMRQLPSDWTAGIKNSVRLGFARGNMDATLRKLEDEGRATEELDEVTLIINNTTGALGGPKFGARLTPTINNDNTVTVLMQVDAGATSGRQTPSVANVRDKDTVMLVASPADDKATHVTLALITPSIVPLPAAPDK